MTSTSSTFIIILWIVRNICAFPYWNWRCWQACMSSTFITYQRHPQPMGYFYPFVLVSIFWPAKSSHDRQHGRLLVDASKRSTTGWLSRGVNHLGWWQESKGTATPNPLVRNFSRSKCWCRPRGSATVVKWPSCRVVVVVMNQRMRGCRDARDALDTLGEIRWLDG